MNSRQGRLFGNAQIYNGPTLCFSWNHGVSNESMFYGQFKLASISSVMVLLHFGNLIIISLQFILKRAFR